METYILYLFFLTVVRPPEDLPFPNYWHLLENQPITHSPSQTMLERKRYAKNTITLIKEPAKR